MKRASGHQGFSRRLQHLKFKLSPLRVRDARSQSDRTMTARIVVRMGSWMQGCKQEKEEKIHYVHLPSKGPRGRLCHGVWASLTMANTRAQTDFCSLCHIGSWHHDNPGNLCIVKETVALQSWPIVLQHESRNILSFLLRQKLYRSSATSNTKRSERCRAT